MITAGVIWLAAGKFETVEYGSEIKVIGVVSDTHIPSRGRSLPAQLFRLFEKVQLILHAGDIVEEQVIDDLEALAPVEAVAGNMDPIRLRNHLGRYKLIRLGDVSIGLLHGDFGGRSLNYDRAKAIFRPEKPQAIVFGHIHEPVAKEVKGTLFFNPGSAVDPRRDSQPSCGRLLVDGTGVSAEILSIE